jgi:hypothetical protein
MISITTLLTCLLTFVSPQEMLQTAQTHIVAEQWEDAAKMLDAFVASTENPAPSINYDRGIAHYKLEQYDQAAKAFEDAMASTDDPTLASYCAYNFGNAVYQSTMRDLEGTTSEDGQTETIIALEAAKKQLGDTINSYRSAIAKNTNDMDARANGELAWKMLQQLSQMQEEIEQQQKQQQDDQNQEQEQDEDTAEEQADNQENTDKGDSKKENQEQQQDGEQSESQDQDSSENQQGEKSEDQKQQDSKPSDQQQDGEQSEDQQEKQQESQSTENSNEEQASPQDQKDTEQTEQENKSQQPNPSEEPGEKELSDFDKGDLESANEGGEQGAVEPKDAKEEGKRLTRSEASRLLQLIRDKEQQRRKLLAARKAANRVPVQKDW